MIKGVGGENLVVDLGVREHTLISGVLESLGGQDEGPDPHELLEAALAGCTVLTVHMYAKRRGFPLKRTHVEVKIVSEGAESLLERKIHFEGELSNEQRARLFEIANRCPIHRLLESKVTIQSELLAQQP